MRQTASQRVSLYFITKEKTNTEPAAAHNVRSAREL
jgi:hypothetical protein